MPEVATAPQPLKAVREEGEERNADIISVTGGLNQTTITIYRHFCKGCEICAEVCPKGVLLMQPASDRWEGSIVEIVDIDACNSCMLCEHQCPDFAIEVYSLKKDLKAKEKKNFA